MHCATSRRRLAINAREIGDAVLCNGPLHAVHRGDWSPAWQQGLMDATQSMQRVSRRMATTALAFATAVGLPLPTLKRDARNGLGLLARVLPLAFENDWRFVLEPNARWISEQLQRGLDLIYKHQETTRQLSSPWPVSTMDALRCGAALLASHRETHAALGLPWSSSTQESVRRGMAWVEQYRELHAQMSLPYGEAVYQMDAYALQAAWRAAESSLWPLSALRKRGVARLMSKCVPGGAGKPDAAQDIKRLVGLRVLEAQILALDGLTEATDGLWRGLTTNAQLTKTAMAFQGTLASAREGNVVNAEIAALLDREACGARLASDAARITQLQSLEAQMERIGDLVDPARELWRGHRSNPEVIAAVLAFQVDLAAAREAKAWHGTHGVVAHGQCGSCLAADLQRMHLLRELQAEIIALDALEEQSQALWMGLRTDVPHLIDALKFFEAISAAIAPLASTPHELSALKASLAPLLGDANALLSIEGPIAGAGTRYLDALCEFKPAIDTFADIAATPTDLRNDLFNTEPSEVDSRMQYLFDAAHRLKSWCAWCKVSDEARAAGACTVSQCDRTGNDRIGPNAPGVRARLLPLVAECRGRRRRRRSRICFGRTRKAHRGFSSTGPAVRFVDPGLGARATVRRLARSGRIKPRP